MEGYQCTRALYAVRGLGCSWRSAVPRGVGVSTASRQSWVHLECNRVRSALGLESDSSAHALSGAGSVCVGGAGLFWNGGVEWRHTLADRPSSLFASLRGPPSSSGFCLWCLCRRRFTVVCRRATPSTMPLAQLRSCGRSLWIWTTTLSSWLLKACTASSR